MYTQGDTSHIQVENKLYKLPRALFLYYTEPFGAINGDSPDRMGGSPATATVIENLTVREWENFVVHCILREYVGYC